MFPRTFYTQIHKSNVSSCLSLTTRGDIEKVFYCQSAFSKIAFKWLAFIWIRFGQSTIMFQAKAKDLRTLLFPSIILQLYARRYCLIIFFFCCIFLLFFTVLILFLTLFSKLWKVLPAKVRLQKPFPTFKVNKNTEKLPFSIETDQQAIPNESKCPYHSLKPLEP